MCDVRWHKEHWKIPVSRTTSFWLHVRVYVFNSAATTKLYVVDLSVWLQVDHAFRFLLLEVPFCCVGPFQGSVANCVAYVPCCAVCARCLSPICNQVQVDICNQERDFNHEVRNRIRTNLSSKMSKGIFFGIFIQFFFSFLFCKSCIKRVPWRKAIFWKHHDKYTFRGNNIAAFFFSEVQVAIVLLPKWPNTRIKLRPVRKTCRRFFSKSK